MIPVTFSSIIHPNINSVSILSIHSIYYTIVLLYTLSLVTLVMSSFIFYVTRVAGDYSNHQGCF